MERQYAGQLSGVAFGGGNAAQMAQITPAPTNALEEHETRLTALVGHLENLAQRAENLADRMFGSTPKSVSENSKEGPNPPAIRRLEMLVTAGHARLDLLNDSLNRLERL